MAIDKRLFIYATFIISCGAVGLIVTAFATESWVFGEIHPLLDGQTKDDVINYGLFSGHLDRYLLTSPESYDLFITCLVAENVCAWSCNRDADERVKELELLHHSGNFTWRCTTTARSLLARRTYKPNTRSYSYSKQISLMEKVQDAQYLNAGVRVSTIVFLSVGLLFAVTGAVFAVVNSAMTPIELITGIFGLYVWNAVALVSDIIVLILWGAHFATTLTHNVAYTEVIYGSATSEGLVQLGYSYWMVLGASLLHIANLALLGVRQMLINREPAQTTVEVEANDGDIFLY